MVIIPCAIMTATACMTQMPVPHARTCCKHCLHVTFALQHHQRASLAALHRRLWSSALRRGDPSRLSAVSCTWTSRRWTSAR